MWVLLIIIFSQPYQVSTVDILGTYSSKKTCAGAQKHAMTIPVPQKTSFGCIKIVGTKRVNHVPRKTRGEK